MEYDIIDNAGEAGLEQQAAPDIEMVFVAGGTFTMGAPDSDPDAFEDEKPAHSVTLPDYYIGRYAVTQKQWTGIMGSNPSEWRGGGLPVENVNWDDVQEFIRRLNARTGMRYRLPTEAEWEFAARGGNGGRGSRYSGGDEIGDVAWYDGNSGGRTHAVGSKSPNELGICDMTGNVWEWCCDWVGGYYAGSPSSDPRGPASGICRVLRGGSWGSDAVGCRVSYRGYCMPDCRESRIGFRLVLPL